MSRDGRMKLDKDIHSDHHSGKSGKQGNIGEFDRCPGNVIKMTKSQGNIRRNAQIKCCQGNHLWFASCLGLFRSLLRTLLLKLGTYYPCPRAVSTSFDNILLFLFVVLNNFIKSSSQQNPICCYFYVGLRFLPPRKMTGSHLL